MTNILFRVEASPEIGIGHFMRCLALAQQLHDLMMTPIFITKTRMPYLLDLAQKEKIEVIQMNPDFSFQEDAIFVSRNANQKSAPWIVLDGYNLMSRSYQEIVGTNGRKILCIDDLAEGHFLCHAIINQNIGAESLPYSCEPYTKLFLGPKYLLVKREFRSLSCWDRPIREKAKNILVTMGGSLAGSSNSILKIGEAIGSLQDSTLEVKIILGSNFQNCSNLKRIMNQFNFNFDLLPFVYDMLNLMKWADLVITAAGSTVWELILAHAPMMILTVADNQKIVEKFLVYYNCAKILGWFENLDIKEITTNIRELIYSNKLRYQLSTKCRALMNNEFDFFDPKLIF